MLTIFPSSNAAAIMPAVSAAPAKSFEIPVTENIAAHNATKVAVRVVIIVSEVFVVIVGNATAVSCPSVAS